MYNQNDCTYSKIKQKRDFPMKTILVPLFNSLLVGFSLVCAQAKPEEGKDWVEVPTIGDGLCVNNLFQSNIVIPSTKYL